MSKMNGETDFLELFLGDFGILNQPMVRPLQSLRDLRAVYKLTHDCYAASGYAPSHPSGFTIHYPHFDHIPETTILVAMLHGRIVGSVSMTESGPSGFTTDHEFKSTTDQLTAEGVRFGVVWRLVVEDSNHTRRSVVVNLMDAMMATLQRKNIPTALFSVNPKHVSVYKRMLNARPIAHSGGTEGLKDAPAALIRFDLADLPSRSVVSGDRTILNPIHQLLSNNAY